MAGVRNILSVLLLALFELAVKRRRKKHIFSSVEYILTIITIIMDRIPSAPNDNVATWILQQQQLHNHGEGIKALKHFLLSESLDLERTKANAESQRQIQEASRLLHLQSLLTATRRERDEAQKLLAAARSERDEAQAQLLKLNAEYSTLLLNTQHGVMSSDRSQQPDTTKLHKLNPSPIAATAVAMHSNSSPLVGLADQIRWNSTGNHFHFAHLDIPLDADLHQPSTSSTKVHCSNLTELQDQPFYHHNDHQRLSLVEQQESNQHQVECHLPHLVQDKLTDYDMWQQQQEKAAAEPAPMAYHGETPPYNTLGSNSAAMPSYLPEPPESDIQVILGNLPERGKLLQAVMQAGPLLQTLLLAGPLPQWKHPPPLLDSKKIPRLSLSSSPNSLPICSMAHYMPNPHSPTAALDPLQVNSPLSSSHQSLSPRTRINESSSAAFISSLQSDTAAASSFSKLL